MALKDLQQEMESQLDKARDAVIDESTFIQFLNVLATDLPGFFGPVQKPFSQVLNGPKIPGQVKGRIYI